MSDIKVSLTLTRTMDFSPLKGRGQKMGVPPGYEPGSPASQCTVHPWHATRALLPGQRFRAHMIPASMMLSDLAHFLHFALLDFVGMWTVRVNLQALDFV